MFDYSRWCHNDIRYSIEFFDEILIELDEEPLYENKSFSPSVLTQSMAIFDLNIKTAVQLTLYFDDNGIRIDIDSLPELIKYLPNDIQRNPEKIKCEIKDILTLEIRITNYSKRYFEIEVLDNDQLIRHYIHGAMLFSWLSLWRRKKELKVYAPIFGRKSLKMQKRMPRESKSRLPVSIFDYARWCHDATEHHLELFDEALMELSEEPLYKNKNVSSLGFFDGDAFFSIETEGSASLTLSFTSEGIRIGLEHVIELIEYPSDIISKEPKRVKHEIKEILISKIYLADYCKRRFKVKVIGAENSIIREVARKKSWFAEKECSPDIKKYAPVFKS